jgi:peptidoglycan/LPS O-acetylase OafA/YrhL
MVLVSHFSNRTELFGYFLGLGAGKLGVVLFFVLSGFLMGWLYREQPFTRENVLGFARRRFARIAPLFVTVTVLTYIIYWTPLEQFRVTPMPTWAFLETILLWKGKGILWTVPVEVQFYAIFPLIWLLSAKWPKLWVPITAIIAVVLMAAVKVRYPVLLDYGAAFLIGVLAAAVKVRLSARTSNVLFVLCFIGFLLLYPGLWRAVGLKGVDSLQSPLHMLVVAAVIWSAAQAPIANAVFGSPPARFLGDISFSLYLLHYMVFHVLEVTPVAQNMPLFVVAFLTLSILLATASHKLLEVPARRWLSGTKASRSTPERAATTATA